MWNMNWMIILVIMIGATGIVTTGLKKNLTVVLGKHSVYSLQKTDKLNITHSMESTAVRNLQLEPGVTVGSR
jgi:hypothetical protein